MLVSLDGGVTFVEAARGVRVIYPDLNVPGAEPGWVGELQVNLTDEGVIIDVWTEFPADPRSDSCNAGTSSETVDEIVARLMEANS